MTLITRTAKGSKLTTAEMDGNLTYLESEAQKYWEADGETGIKPKDSKKIDASNIDGLEPYENLIIADRATLEVLVAGNLLEVGKDYLLSDFAQSYNIFDGGTMGIIEEKVGALEPLILKAISSSKFDKVAISPLRPNDIIHYSFDILDIRDIGFGNGVDTVNANFKGQIYYRKDTIQNVETHYDFHNVKFRRWAVDAVAFNKDVAYVAKDVCKASDGKIYKCITATTGEGDPTVNTADWVLWLDITVDAFVSWTSDKSDKTNFNIGDIIPKNLIINNVTAGVDYDDFYTFGDYYNWVKNVSIGMIDLENVKNAFGYLSTLNNIVCKTVDIHTSVMRLSIMENVRNFTIYAEHIKDFIINSYCSYICLFANVNDSEILSGSTRSILKSNEIYNSKFNMQHSCLNSNITEINFLWFLYITTDKKFKNITSNLVILNGLNFSSAVIISTDYSKTIYQDKTDGIKLSYMDGGVPQYVDVTA